MHVDRDAAAVVDDRDGVVFLDGHVDVVAIARERLVDGVVDDFVDEVVQAALRRRADVHARTLADGLEAFENLDLVGTVVGIDGRDLSARLIRVNRHAREVEVFVLELGIHLRRSCLDILGVLCLREIDMLVFFSHESCLLSLSIS